MLLWLLTSSFLALVWRNRHLGSFCLIRTIWLYLRWLSLNTQIPPSKIKVDLKATSFLSLTKRLHDNKACLKYIISLEPGNLGERCCTAVCLQACLDFILHIYQVSWRRIDAKSSLNSQCLGPPTPPCSPTTLWFHQVDTGQRFVLNTEYGVEKLPGVLWEESRGSQHAYN